MPTTEDILGKPSADDLLGPPPMNTGEIAWGGAAMDDYFSSGSLAYVLDKFGQGFRQGWGAQPLGLSPETEQGLRRLGLFNDIEHGQNTYARNFNDTLIRPLAAVYDAASRAVTGLGRGLLETDGPLALPGAAILAGSEAFPAAHLTGLPAALSLPELNRAAALKVIGHGEAGWQGFDADAAARQALTPPAPTGMPAEGGFVAPLRAEARLPPVPEAAPPAPDIHQLARSIAPGSFAEYDPLAQRKEVFRRWLDELADTRANSDQAQALRAPIDDILGKVGGDEDRLTKAAAARLDRARAALDDYLGSDTPDMARVRADLMQADYRMRDLATEVSAAYREAKTRMPQPEPAASNEVQKINMAPEVAAEPAGEGKPASATPVAGGLVPPTPASPEAPLALPIPKGTAEDIAGDVSRKLVAAGRPKQEADAAAAILASHYEARAQRFQGALGSGFDLYRAEGPDIRFRQQGGPGGAASGRSTLNGARTIVTLFRKADASTFLHETGHQWLDELLRDAQHPQAPDELKADADAVRQWAGIRGNPTTKQHEQVARGFEAYMLEGRAPSAGLARVFAQFRQWLLSIYDAVKQQKLPVIDSVRGVFDRLVGMDTDRPILAPDRELPLSYAERHEQAAAALVPPAAEPVGDLVRDDRDRAGTAELEDTEDDRRRAARLPERPPGGGAAGGGASDGQGARPGPLPGEARELQAAGALGAGGADHPPQGGAASNQPLRLKRPVTAYQEIPPAPPRLWHWLKTKGGVADDGGELRAIDAHKRPGLVNKEGMSLDDAALAAAEAGYFPHLAPGERPTIGEFLDLLDRDLRGEPVYSGNDAEALAKHRAAVEQNHQIDRLGAQFGIDPRHWTEDQFWHLVAEHQGAEEAQRSLADALAGEYEAAEAKAREWAESRGDAWEPEQHATRSLEDIEREAAAERLAQEGGGGAGGAGPAAGDRRAVQDGARQGGGGGNAGGGDIPATERGRFAAGDRLIDKAGNIRLDNLALPEEVDQVIRDVAARNAGFLPERRGVLSDAEVLDLAEALGRDPVFLDAKKIGAAFSAEEVVAARLLLRQASTRVHELMAGDPVDPGQVTAFAEAVARLEMIQSKVAQATAETGRALRAFRDLGPDTDLADFLKANTGRTLYQMQQMMRLGQRLASPAQVAQFVADTGAGRIRRAIVYYWVNTLISGPITHARYSVGNALNALWTPLVETPIAAGIGAGREALGLAAAGDRVQFAEASAQLYALSKGFRDGVTAGWEAFRTGQSPALPGERVPQLFATGLNNPIGDALPPALRPLGNAVGEAVGVPGRAVAAIHSFFKAVRYEQAIAAQAVRQAIGEGLDGSARDLRVADLTAHPPEAMMEAATGSALKELYMRPSDYQSGAAFLNRVTDRWLLAKIMMPFLKIGSQITRNAFIERTPLALLDREVRGNLLGNSAAGDMQAAKITAGIGLAGAMSAMVLEGLATGDGPTDPKERAVWLLNHRPNAVTIGAVTIPYQGLGHLGMLMRLAANMTETAHGWQGEDGGKLAVSFLEGFTRAVLDENFMRGLKDMLDAVFHPQDYGAAYIRNFAVNWLPYSIGLGQVERATDPWQRDAHTLIDSVKARIPGLAETLPPRRDRFGEPIPANAGLAGISENRYANDRTVRAMEEVHTGIGRLDRNIRGVELSPEQYDDFSRLAGRFSKLRLDLLTANPAWSQIPAPARVELIHKTIEGARETARSTLLMQHPELVRQAVAAKTLKLTGGAP